MAAQKVENECSLFCIWNRREYAAVLTCNSHWSTWQADFLHPRDNNHIFYAAHHRDRMPGRDCSDSTNHYPLCKCHYLLLILSRKLFILLCLMPFVVLHYPHRPLASLSIPYKPSKTCSILIALIFIIENNCINVDYIAHRYQSSSFISTSKSFLLRPLLSVLGPTLRLQVLLFLPRIIRWQRTTTIHCSSCCWAATLLTSIFRLDAIIRSLLSTWYWRHHQLLQH